MVHQTPWQLENYGGATLIAGDSMLDRADELALTTARDRDLHAGRATEVHVGCAARRCNALPFADLSVGDYLPVIRVIGNDAIIAGLYWNGDPKISLGWRVIVFHVDGDENQPIAQR